MASSGVLTSINIDIVLAATGKENCRNAAPLWCGARTTAEGSLTIRTVYPFGMFDLANIRTTLVSKVRLDVRALSGRSSTILLVQVAEIQRLG